MATAEDSILGRGWAFPVTFDRSQKSVAMVSGVEDIDQSLRILFATSPGDRILQPDYGCDVRRFLFQQLDLTAQTELQDMLSTAILNWEPRIRVNAITVDATDSLDGVLQVEIDYTVRATNSRSNRVYPLYLQQGTNL